MNKRNHIIHLEAKLTILRKRWREGSAAMRMIIEDEAGVINRQIVMLERLDRKSLEKNRSLFEN